MITTNTYYNTITLAQLQEIRHRAGKIFDAEKLDKQTRTSKGHAAAAREVRRQASQIIRVVQDVIDMNSGISYREETDNMREQMEEVGRELIG